MNERETERRLRDWLDAQASTLVPDNLRRSVVAIPATVTVGWPDRLAAAFGTRRAVVPRVAWVMLMLAGLLAAMVAGTLLVGSQLERRLPAMVPPVAPTATTSTARTTVSEGTYTAVSADGSHTCAIKTDGTIVCWGANSSGQATPPDGTHIAVSAGGDHTCAIRTDWTIVCWGANSSGQATPPDGTYVTVSAGARYTCAIRTDGKLMCWGDDSYGEATAPSGTYSAVDAGQAITCAIRTDRTLTCWGFDDEGRLSPPAGTYASVDAFGQCAIRTDGTLACWGTGGTEPTPPPGTYLAVSGAWGGPCAIRTDGTLTCWGTDAEPLPPAGSYTALSAGLPGYEACAIRTDGKLTCWGSDWIAKTDMGGNWMGPPTTLIPDIRSILPASDEMHRGTVEFGSGGSGCGITTPSTSFSVGDTIHVAANLKRELRADEVVSIALSVNGNLMERDFPGETVSRTFDVPGDCVGGVLHWAYAAPPWSDPSAFPISWTTGHYRLELSTGGKVLAEGEFDVGPSAVGATPTPAPTATATTALDQGSDILATTNARPLPAQATCPAGSTPDQPGPVGQARPSSFNHLDLYTHVAFDRHAGRLLVLAPAAGTPNDVETWTFDVCANTWAQMNPNQEPSGFAAGAKLIYDLDSGVTIAFEFNQLRTVAYDLDANTWEENSFAPNVAGYDVRPGWTRSSDLARLIYDAVSGLVVDWNYAGGFWSYDVETDAWTSIRQSNPPAIRIYGSLFAYDTSVDRVIAYANTGEPGGAATWLFDIRTGAWSKSGAVTPDFGSDPAIAYDEASERTVIVGGGRSAAYDATADRWETLFEGSASGDQSAGCATRPECRQGHQMIYDPVNERLVVYGGGVPAAAVEDWVYPDDVLAFDLETREWTVLLAPSDGGAASTDCGSGPVVSVRPGSAPDRAQPSTGPDRSPWVPAAKVTLHGGPFFTRVAGVGDEPWTSSPPAAPASVVDGLFLPECQLWTQGTVWWEQSNLLSRAWIEIDLGGSFVLDAAVVQADVNDEYRLSYRDPETAAWVTLWDVSLGDAGGMATRPKQRDASVRWPLAPSVVTDALRFEATSGDAQYSVSEIAVFGQPAP